MCGISIHDVLRFDCSLEHFTVGGSMLAGLDGEHDLVTRKNSRNRVYPSAQSFA